MYVIVQMVDPEWESGQEMRYVDVALNINLVSLIQPRKYLEGHCFLELSPDRRLVVKGTVQQLSSLFNSADRMIVNKFVMDELNPFNLGATTASS